MALPALLSGLGNQIIKKDTKSVPKSALVEQKNNAVDNKLSTETNGKQTTSGKSGALTVRPSSSLVRKPSISTKIFPKEKYQKSSESSSLLIIKEKVIQIENILSNSFKFKRKESENQRKLLETSGRKRKEEKLESPKENKSKGLSIPIPGKGLFDQLMSKLFNFLFWIAIGKLYPTLVKLIPAALSVVETLLNVGSIFIDVIGKILDFTITAVDGAYNFIYNVEEKLKELGGEDVEGPIKAFKDAFGKVLNIALIAALLGVGGPETLQKPDRKKPDGKRSVGGRPDGNGKSKPKSDLVRWKDRDPVGGGIRKKHGLEAHRAYQNEYKNGIDKGLSKTQAAIRAKKKVESLIRKRRITSSPLKGSLAGGLKGSTISKGGAGRTFQRGATRLFGKTSGKLASGVSSKLSSFAIKSVARRIPIVGPLFIGMDAYLNGDSVYQYGDEAYRKSNGEKGKGPGESGIPPGKLDYTLFKALGAGLGGFLGTFIPIPVVGTLLGELVGEYVGELLYLLLKGGGIDVVGKKLSRDIKGLFDLGKAGFKFMLEGGKKFFNNYPKFRIPNFAIPGPLRSILEAATLWRAGKFEGVHDLLGKWPMSPFKFISDNEWFGNKKGKLSHLPDPTFFVRDPIGLAKHFAKSFFDFGAFKPRPYKPPSVPGFFGGDTSGRGGSGSPLRTYNVLDSGQAGGAIEPGNAMSIVSSMGFSKEDWDLFRNTIAKIESGGRYDIAGGSGGHYDGRYQLGAAAKTDGAKFAGIQDPGHSPAARAAFRKNPQLQEVLFAGYAKANHTYLSRNRKYKNSNPQRKLQILGYAHNQGMGGAENWLNTGKVGADGFGTKGTKYTDALAAEFRKRTRSSQQSPLRTFRVPTQPDKNTGNPQTSSAAPNAGSGKGKKIYLHWTAGTYSGVPKAAYHTVITGDGKTHYRIPYTQTGEHTWKRNNNSVGFSVAAMSGATPENFGRSPVKSSQYQTMAKEVAKLATAWKWRPTDINVRNVLTHAEAGSNKDGWNAHENYGPVAWGGDGDKWDLAKLYQGDQFGSGGDKIRSMIKSYMKAPAMKGGGRIPDVNSFTSYENPQSNTKIIMIPVPVPTPSPSMSPMVSKSLQSIPEMRSLNSMGGSISKIHQLSRS
jgi:hypothetical protein